MKTNYERFIEFQRILNSIKSITDKFCVGYGKEKTDTLSFNLKDRKNVPALAQYAIKYFPDKSVFIVWDLALRKRYGGTMNLWIDKKWLEICPDEFTMYAAYPTFNGDDGKSYYNKVLVVGERNYKEFFENYTSWMKFNSDDENYPINQHVSEDCKIEEYKWPNDVERKRYSTKKKQRDGRFRKAVLEAYDYRCAICRCEIRELLQAAHLHNYAVAKSKLSADHPDHGICLCANHHLMYDSHLIEIDVKNSVVKVLDERIKKTSYYKEFEKYDFRLLKKG